MEHRIQGAVRPTNSAAVSVNEARSEASMENQKILWIVFSITLFVLVVVVVGFIWFLPPESEASGTGFAEAGVVSETTTVGFDPIEWVRGTEAVPGITESDSESETKDDMFLVIGATEESDAPDEPEDGADAKADTGDTPADSESVTTVRVATPSTARTTTTREAAPAASTPATSTTPRPRQIATPPAPRTVRITNYWIQVASFQSRSRAEDVQTVLGEKGFSARITSIDQSDTTFFRVRIGPYESKPDAEKFLGWLKEVDSFGTSYISEVYTTRNAN